MRTSRLKLEREILSKSRGLVRSTNPLEPLNREIKRRTNVASHLPNEAAIVCLVGAILLEQNDEWAVTRRYMSLETMGRLCNDQGVGTKAIPAT